VQNTGTTTTRSSRRRQASSWAATNTVCSLIDEEASALLSSLVGNFTQPVTVGNAYEYVQTYSQVPSEPGSTPVNETTNVAAPVETQEQSGSASSEDENARLADFFHPEGASEPRVGFARRAQAYIREGMDFKRVRALASEKLDDMRERFKVMLENMCVGAIDTVIGVYLRKNTPMIIDLCLDVMSAVGIYQTGGWASLAIYLQAMLRHWFPGWQHKCLELLRVGLRIGTGEASQAGGNPVWLVVLGAGVLTCKMLEVSFDIRTLITGTIAMSALYRNTEAITDMFRWVVDLLPECLSQWIPSVFSGSTGRKTLIAAVGRLNEISSWSPTQKLRSDKILQFVDAYRDLYRKFTLYADTVGPGTVNIVSRLLAQQQQTYELANAKLGKTSQRLPPFWIYLFGAPGVGKSWITSSIISDLAGAGAFDDFRDEKGKLAFDLLKFARNKGYFWDGYQGQPVVICDDYNCTIDDPIVPETINMVSCEEFIPQFASLDNEMIGRKGTAFTSAFFISSSNSVKINYNGLNSSSAVYRRRSVVAKVICKPEFYDEKNSRVMMDKVNKKYAAEILGDVNYVRRDYPHLEFQLFGSCATDETRAISLPMNYRSFIFLVVAMQREHFSQVITPMGDSELFKDGRAVSKFYLNEVRGGERPQMMNNELKPGDNPVDLLSASRLGVDALADSFVKIESAGDIPKAGRRETLDDLFPNKEEIEAEAGDTCESLASVRSMCGLCGNCHHCQECVYCRLVLHHLRVLKRSQWDARNYSYKNSLLRVCDWTQCAERHTGSRDPAKCWSCRVVEGIPPSIRKVAIKKFESIGPINGLSRFADIREIGNVHASGKSLDESLCKFIPCTDPAGSVCVLCSARVARFDLTKVADEELKDSIGYRVLKYLIYGLSSIGTGYALYKAGKALVDKCRVVGEETVVGADGLVQEFIGGPKSNTTAMGVVQETLADGEQAKRVYAADISSRKEDRKERIVTPKYRSFEHEQGVAMDKAFEAVDSVVHHMTAGLLLHQEGKGSYGGSCVLLADRWFCMPVHYLHNFDKDRPVAFEMTRPGMLDGPFAKFTLHPKSESFRYLSGNGGIIITADVVFVEAPKQVSSWRNNINHILDEKALDRVSTVDSYVVGYDYNRVYEIIQVKPKFVRCLEQNPSVRTYCVDSWRYDSAGFRDGDCGKLVVLPRSAFGYIGGFHRGCFQQYSIGGFAEAQLLTRQLVERVIGLKQIPSELCQSKWHPDPNGSYMILPPEGADVMLIGALKEKDAVRLSEKSVIKKSPLHPDVCGKTDYPWSKVTKEPAILSAKDPRHNVENVSPLVGAIGKYRQPTEFLNPISLEVARKWMFADFCAADKAPDLCRVLTEDEAINGIEGLPYVERLDMDTSPGFPYTRVRPPGETGKRFLFNEVEPNKFEVRSHELRWQLDMREALAKEGMKMPNSFWTDCLKDEKLKLSKIEKSKTRLFNIGPVDHLILSKRYFGAFSRFFHMFRKSGWSSPGINTRSMEWTEEYRYLLEVGFRGFDGDFAEFDGRTWAIAIEVACLAINDWYRRFDPNWKEEDDFVRIVLLQECQQPLHIAQNCVYQSYSGCPSGYFLTAVVNCCVNFVMTVCAFRDLVKDCTWESWKRNLRMKFYGDDNKYCVSEEIIQDFNGRTLSAWYAQRGISYTPADKASEFGDPKPVLELEYLKCKSRMLNNGVVVPLIADSSINEAVNWIYSDSAMTPWEVLQSSIPNVMDFLVFYGRQRYTQYEEAFNTEAARQGATLVVPSFDECLEKLVTHCHFDDSILHSDIGGN
jgi:hypothetical protein